MLVYFAKGGLPWQYVTGQDKEQKFSKIREIKNTILVEELCEGLPGINFILFYLFSKFCFVLFKKQPFN